MQTNSKLWATLVVVAIIAISGNFYPLGKVVEKVIQVGATSSLEGVDSPFVGINGVKDTYITQGLTATSSTICSIVNPRNSTSTILSFTVNIKTGILGANNMSLSTSTDGYSTSTAFFILDRAVASGVGDTFSWQPSIASTTNPRLVALNNNGSSPYFLRPGERLNLRISTTTAAGALAAYYQGTCSAVLRDN